MKLKLRFQPSHFRANAQIIPEVGKWNRALTTSHVGVSFHIIEGSADIRGEIDVVDDQQIRADNSRSARTRDPVTPGDMDHIDRDVSRFRTEGNCQIVAAA